MKVQKDAAVTVEIQIVDGGSAAPVQEMTYLHGGYDNLVPKLEASLEGLEPGAKKSVTLTPADGFGEHDPALVRREPLDRLPEGVTVGSSLHGQPEKDGGHPRVFRVTAMSKTEATLDANHPLAGRTVEVRLAVVDVREATDEEIAHGHVHGPGGHGH
jgi:FKBP-type peptidyl-prolyl cis-trans isomerase SlyD